ncbi:putative secreted protein (Por secretion system target) [Aquimarina sp. MAR_2010_214]|uniref:DUF3472 domain-containing protein n=1 Tax=Aquimarina sp. MAR_2010_214 TaxID=1250026 RepID=UPI000C710EE3|nr:RICIN domain-containing protein [Aquimarina sp. MAR_2010_214]PKV49162.1 putative secreted protein (Por secretion system target) [Aquimarina sp. MAR_2010_214]
MKNTIFFLVLISIINFSSAQNSAPSSHLRANDNGTGDILMKTVRSTITTNATYYCTMQWNAGSEGGAYCGFQDSPDKGHVFIYSIWDPSNGQAITADYVGPGTIVENFGGEGTGLKSMNPTIGWNLNEWNTVVTRRWNVGSHTYFGFWIRRDSQNKWYHMVTMNYPVSGVTFNGTTNAFLEDWLSTGMHKRRFEMKDGFKRKTNGTWAPMNQGTYNRNVEPRSSNYTNAVDAGADDGIYFMQSGGNTSPSFSGNPPITFNTDTNAAPSNPAISFSIQSVSSSNISWNVPTSSTPQFKYTIKVDGNTVKSIIAPETRSSSISASSGSVVEVILEDILGRTSKHTVTVDNDTLPSGTYNITFEHNGKALTAQGNSNGSNIQINNYNEESLQKWEVTNLGNSIYKIINVNSRKSLDAFGQNNGDNIGSYTYHGGSNQKWKISKLDTNIYKVIDSRSQKSIDAFGTNNNANVGIYEYHGGNNQRLKFTSISTAKNNIQPNLSVYTNHKSGILNIQTNDALQEKTDIDVYTIQGVRVIHKEISTQNVSEINISDLAKGIYIIRSGESLIKKFVVK